MHTENPVAVANKIAELSRTTPGTWQAINGFSAITGLDLSGETPNFLAANGYPVKVFVNLESGEVKIFSAYPFFAS